MVWHNFRQFDQPAGVAVDAAGRAVDPQELPCTRDPYMWEVAHPDSAVAVALCRTRCPALAWCSRQLPIPEMVLAGKAYGRLGRPMGACSICAAPVRQPNAKRCAFCAEAYTESGNLRPRYRHDAGLDELPYPWEDASTTDTEEAS